MDAYAIPANPVFEKGLIFGLDYGFITRSLTRHTAARQCSQSREVALTRHPASGAILVVGGGTQYGFRTTAAPFGPAQPAR